MIDDDQKIRITNQARVLLAAVVDMLDDPGTHSLETLAALYATAQVLERELMIRGQGPEVLGRVRDVGRRLGAGMVVVVEEDSIN